MRRTLDNSPLAADGQRHRCHLIRKIEHHDHDLPVRIEKRNRLERIVRCRAEDPPGAWLNEAREMADVEIGTLKE